MDLFGTYVNGVIYKKDSYFKVYHVAKALFPNKKCVIESEIKGVSVSRINKKAFKNSTVEEIVIPEGMGGINEKAFMNSHIREVKFPESLKCIGDSSFQNCVNLETVELSPKCDDITFDVFRGCINLKNINLDHIKSIGRGAFFMCASLSKISLNSVNKIYSGAFNGCVGLETVIIGDNCTIIDRGAFKDCINLKTVVLPLKINNIGGIYGKVYGSLTNRNNPFAGCENLKRLLFHGTPNEINISVRNFFVNECQLDIYYYSEEPKKGTWCYNKENIVVR